MQESWSDRDTWYDIQCEHGVKLATCTDDHPGLSDDDEQQEIAVENVNTGVRSCVWCCCRIDEATDDKRCRDRKHALIAVADWEQQYGTEPIAWHPLEPAKVLIESSKHLDTSHLRIVDKCQCS